jgi:hypothetical protein
MDAGEGRLNAGNPASGKPAKGAENPPEKSETRKQVKLKEPLGPFSFIYR